MSAEPSIWTRPARVPRRPALSQDAIVRAAIDVANAGGPEALTMQAVAQALGAFTPMSLYRYVFSKEGLVDLMLDAVLAEAKPAERSSGNWSTDVYELELRTWQAIMRHPWFAQLVHTRPPLGPDALRRTEYLLDVFTNVSADIGTAMGYVSLVERLVIGLALQVGEEARAGLQVDVASQDSAYAALEPLRLLTSETTQYPLLARWAAAPSGPTPSSNWSLACACCWTASRRATRSVAGRAAAARTDQPHKKYYINCCICHIPGCMVSIPRERSRACSTSLRISARASFAASATACSASPILSCRRRAHSAHASCAPTSSGARSSPARVRTVGTRSTRCWGSWVETRSSG